MTDVLKGEGVEHLNGVGGPGKNLGIKRLFKRKEVLGYRNLVR